VKSSAPGSKPGPKPRSKSVTRRTVRKPAAGAVFDPATFLETNASGRVISTHSRKGVIFSQGDDADIFYIRKGKVKVAILSSQGKEAVVALLGPDEFVRRGQTFGLSDQTSFTVRSGRFAPERAR
jgi:CRP/FNR family cyclic AMP-dependent transcriptional regulator